MPDLKISAMTDGGAAVDTDDILAVRAGANVRVQLSGKANAVTGATNGQLQEWDGTAWQSISPLREVVGSFSGGSDRLIFEWKATHDFTVIRVDTSSPDNSWDMAATIGGAAITGIDGVTVNVTANTAFAATAANTGTAGQVLQFSSANNSASSDIGFTFVIQKTGVFV